MMDVSIIIVNFNTKQLLADCLASIYCETNGLSFEIIIVDNASVDGSEYFICSQYPEVIWINSEKNLGFGRANNLGARHAKGEYLFLLNSDTVFRNNALYIFLDYIQRHKKEKIGALGCFLLDKDGKSNNSGGCFPAPCSEISYLFKKALRQTISLSNQDVDVDFIVGADLFIKRDLFEYLEGFDSNIFMYYEETDLQYRMAKDGLKRRLIHGPLIVHLEGGSFFDKGLTYSRFIMSQKSYNYYLSKHFHGLNFTYYRLVLVIVRLLLFVTTNWSLKEKIKAYKLVITGSIKS